MTSMLLHGDCLTLLEEFPPDSIASVVTDPPYHLKAKANSAGFMGKKWDGGNVAFDPATWHKALRVMKPGAYLVAFGGTRTYHRLACAIEDAGFEIRDQLAWVYGSGFPKGTDKAKIPPEWQGFNTALKPAWEPIVLARKPMIGTLAENLQAHGCGVLNIEGCRIAGVKDIPASPRRAAQNATYGDLSKYPGTGSGWDKNIGRWPANIVHDGSDEVLECFPNAPGQQGALTGNEPSGPLGHANTYSRMDRRHAAVPRNDSGSAARFFYCAKASRKDRNTGGVVNNNHPTVKPTDLMRWLVRLVTPPGGAVLDMFMGSGSTGVAAVLERFTFVGIEDDKESFPLAEQRIAAVDPAEKKAA